MKDALWVSQNLYTFVRILIHFTPTVIFTVRNSSCGKVMFSPASVILSTGRACVARRGWAWQGRVWCRKGGHAWQGGGVCGMRDGHGSERYASYWNANLVDLYRYKILFHFQVEVLASLARPKKVTLLGSDGKLYPMMCKPKDDLRKDARLMEFNSIVNKCLRKDPESRRRDLHIRTYVSLGTIR